ncbi:MAG: nucleotide exchange factor GrpE, partial [candidate division Zixibacteria bacterium]|nr:nucleotide exchange factor GrpE [candidate division Zixibacteria bacterium]
MKEDKDKKAIEIEINEDSEEKVEDSEKKSKESPEAEPEEKTPEKIIEDLETKIREQEDRYLRLVAEFDNYKKRNARLYESMIQSSRESLLSPLLEVIDNFERALESSQNSDVKSFKKGTKLIYQQLNELLKKEGVE